MVKAVVSKTDYEEQAREYARRFGGFLNAHVHGDRAFTREDEYYDHVGLTIDDLERLTLPEKQSLVWAVHKGSAFKPECIEQRVRKLVEDSIRYGVTRLDTTVDVTYNTRFVSFDIIEKLKKEYADKIKIGIGAYNVAGFKDSRPERFEIFEEAARRADFLVALAEKDRKPGHIGEHEHSIYMLELGLELGKQVHFHVGQANTPDDRGAEVLFEDMSWVYNRKHRLQTYPRNSLIHDISAACYSEDDFKKHCVQMQRFNLGLICCPSAALSMLQDRGQVAPIHNCFARVWDMVLRKIPVNIGIDNVEDMFVSSSTPDPVDELRLLAPGLRFYNPRVLAKTACGAELDDFDRGTITRALS